MTDEELEELAAQNQQLKRAYQLCFSSPAGVAVLNDLARFCRVVQTTFVPGDRDLGLIYEGRRQVFLAISLFMNFTIEEQAALQAGRYIRRPEDA
jgi:hypothetical protein